MTRDDLLTLAQRMREYNHNPHHINPVSESFHTLIKDSADALSAVAKELTALKAQQVGQELDELRRACAEILGQDPEAWPSHGNAPLAIASALALAVSTAPQPAPAAHPDDSAVDRFAAAMKAKLAKARDKGRGGWDDPAQCSVEFLAKLLVEHLSKGNAGTFEDVANFAMMLHQRDADPKVLACAAAQDQGEMQRLLKDYRSLLVARRFPDNDEGDFGARIRDQELRRIDAALGASTGQEAKP